MPSNPPRSPLVIGDSHLPPLEVVEHPAVQALQLGEVLLRSLVSLPPPVAIEHFLGVELADGPKDPRQVGVAGVQRGDQFAVPSEVGGAKGHERLALLLGELDPFSCRMRLVRGVEDGAALEEVVGAAFYLPHRLGLLEQQLQGPVIRGVEVSKVFVVRAHPVPRTLRAGLDFAAQRLRIGQEAGPPLLTSPGSGQVSLQLGPPPLPGLPKEIGQAKPLPLSSGRPHRIGDGPLGVVHLVDSRNEEGLEEPRVLPLVGPAGLVSAPLLGPGQDLLHPSGGGGEEQHRRQVGVALPPHPRGGPPQVLAELGPQARDAHGPPVHLDQRVVGGRSFPNDDGRVGNHG